MEKIIDPLTGKLDCKLIENIPVEIIQKRYKKDYRIDVSRFFNSKNIQIYESVPTGFRFYYPFNLVGDDKLYEDLQMLGGYYSQWNWEHEVVHKLINKNDIILEVGCGTGSFLEKLKNEGVDAVGLELNKKAVEVCTSKGLQVYDELLDAHKQQNAGKYDLVCSFQVLEHVVDPKSFIEECIDIVKPGGKIIFGVPNNNPYLFKRDKYHTLNLPPHHMGLWSVGAFKNLPNHFKIIEKQILVEQLFNKRYYLNTLLDYNKLSFFKKIFNKIPNSAINVFSKIGNWKGRNLVAIFEKK